MNSETNDFDDNNLALIVFEILNKLRDTKFADDHEICDDCLVYFKKTANHKHYYQHDELLHDQIE